MAITHQEPSLLEPTLKLPLHPETAMADLVTDILAHGPLLRSGAGSESAGVRAMSDEELCDLVRLLAVDAQVQGVLAPTGSCQLANLGPAVTV